MPACGCGAEGRVAVSEPVVILEILRGPCALRIVTDTPEGDTGQLDFRAEAGEQLVLRGTVETGPAPDPPGPPR